MKICSVKHVPWLAAAMLMMPLAAQAGPGPDLKATKSCQLDPAKGPTAISCVINVVNIGTVPSVSPVTIVDTPTGPPGTTFTSASGSFGCSTPIGALPATINCGAPYSLAIGNAPGASGSTFLYFKLPPQGGTFKNCVSVTQGRNAATLPDPDPSNNTNICTSITVKGGGDLPPPDLSATKDCKKGANNSVTCTITITNHGTTPSVAPLSLVDTVSPVLPGTLYTGAGGNVSCSGAGAYTHPITCSYLQPILPGHPVVVLLSFTVRDKGIFANCAKITQGGAVAEANLTNNDSCTKISMP